MKKALLQKRQADLAAKNYAANFARLHGLTKGALDVIALCLELKKQNPKVALAAAIEVLDRTGFEKKQLIESATVTETNTHITVEFVGSNTSKAAKQTVDIDLPQVTSARRQ